MLYIKRNIPLVPVLFKITWIYICCPASIRINSTPQNYIPGLAENLLITKPFQRQPLLVVCGK